MSAPFDPGDVVVCVDATTLNPWSQEPTTISAGAVDRVMSVYRHPLGHWGVALKHHRPRPGCSGYMASRFRKIEAPDTEIARQIRACKPAKQGVRV